MIVFSTICVLILSVLYYVYYSITKNHDYWRIRNVPYVKPFLFFGNYKDYILLKKYSPKIAQEICLKFPNEPYVGAFYGTDPALIVKDPALIKLVLTKDFYYFSHREISTHLHKELLTENMFFNGGDTWKVLRQNLTSLFTSAKLKNTFYLIESCANSLEATLARELKQKNTIDMKSLLTRYTMDCIGTCTFGISTNTLKQDSSTNPFTIIGETIFDNSNYGGLKLVVRSMWPSIFYGSGYNLMERRVKDFFEKLLTDVFKSRQYKESSRNDFVDFILSWNAEKCISGDSISNIKTGEKKTVNLDVNDKLLIGQCVLFFGAGFETTSTSLSFLLYELAKDRDAQNRVVKEIDEYYQRHDGKIEYECINEMPFLQACIQESLRLYPVLGIVTREVTENYTFPTGLRLEKGTRIHLPVYHLHHNPEYFPEPEEFRPERFFGDGEKNIIPYTYMPFGEGSRICIGARFAKMPMVAALLTVFKNYTVELADGMPLKFDFEPRAFTTQANCEINLKFTNRNS